MKRMAALVLIVLGTYACNKNSSPSPNPPRPDVTGLPTASTIYYPDDHLITFRNYLYDSNQNLAGVYLRQNDTVDVIAGTSEVDSGSYHFIIDPKTNLPTSYILDYRKASDNQTQVELRLMYYNSQNQIIKDSGVSIIAGEGQLGTKYYIYSGSTIICNSYIGSALSYVDTIMTSNGNLSYYSQYNGAAAKVFSYSYSSYTAYANPFYNQGLANSLGAFLIVEGVGDFLSKNLLADGGFTWVMGSNGKVASGTNSAGIYETFTY